MNARKPLLLAGLLGTALIAAPVYAEEAAAPAAAETAAPAAPAAVEPASPHTLSANIGFFGQYVFRGITYTNERPAVQGGFDYAHSSGLYAGIWGTNVDDAGLYGNTLEIDLYGGFANTIGDTGIGYNLGFLQFYYPDNDKIAGQSPNTTELNAALSYKWFTVKYSRAVTDFFGLNSVSLGDGKGDTKGSDYWELNFNYVLPKDINLALHVGHQTVEDRSDFDYTDFLVGLNKNFSIAGSTGWNAGFNYTTTDADDDIWVDGNGHETGDDHLILFVKRTF
jgi:uncharacterized protein (TIGR02001 family)